MATLLLQVAGAALGTVLGGPAGGAIGQALGGLAGAAIDQSWLGGSGGNKIVDGPRLNVARRDLLHLLARSSAFYSQKLGNLISL